MQFSKGIESYGEASWIDQEIPDSLGLGLALGPGLLFNSEL